MQRSSFLPPLQRSHLFLSFASNVACVDRGVALYILHVASMWFILHPSSCICLVLRICSDLSSRWQCSHHHFADQQACVRRPAKAWHGLFAFSIEGGFFFQKLGVIIHAASTTAQAAGHQNGACQLRGLGGPRGRLVAVGLRSCVHVFRSLADVLRFRACSDQHSIDQIFGQCSCTRLFRISKM